MSEANTISQGSNDTSLPRASGSNVPSGSDENTQGTAKKASEGGDNETESVSSTQSTTQDDQRDRGVMKAQPKPELPAKKEISDPETDTCQTEQNASTPKPKTQSQPVDSRGNSVNSESVDEIQLPVEGEMISTAGCKQENPEKEDDVNQISFDEPSKDPPLETQTTDPPSPGGGVEDVPRGGVEDVPRGGEDVPHGGEDVQDGGVEDVPGGGVEDVPRGGVEDVPRGGVEDVPRGGEDVPHGGVEDVPGGGVEDVPRAGVDVPRGGVEDVPRGGEDVPHGGVEDVPHGGVEDVPGGGVEDVPGGGVEDVPRGIEDVPRAGIEDVPRAGVDVPRGGVEDVPHAGVEDVPRGVEDVPRGGEDVPHGGVEDVPGGGVEDVPRGGVEDVPRGGVEDVPRAGVDVPRGGVEDVPHAGVEDVPRGGVGDVSDGRTNYSSGLNQPENEGNSTKFMVIGILGLVLSICCAVLLQPKSAPEKVEFSPVDVFLKEMDRVKVQFPGQHLELWRRSKIHLKRHLQTAHPKEPVSLILTAGRRAERTLHCLAQGLASALSSALNGSVLQIDGDIMAGQDSNQVKFDIDDKLRRAFEGDKPVAVIHRFEELPPGSTIIFYRYCDHENAAYKRASLIFTVLLEGKEEVSGSLGLSAVEEMVGDHLKDKFLSSDHPASFDSMDTDKLSGLWSRISHLILPVAAEERVEQRGCGGA